MTSVLKIAPVVKTITVRASQQRAFDVFTREIASWWPRTHHIGSAPVADVVLEPGVGGRWLTRHQDGTERVFGHLRAWDPPNGFVASWEINAKWGADAEVASEVEVRFVAEAPDRTRVEVEHRDFEVLGREGGLKVRNDVSGGWPIVLQRFGEVAERMS